MLLNFCGLCRLATSRHSFHQPRFIFINLLVVTSDSYNVEARVLEFQEHIDSTTKDAFKSFFKAIQLPLQFFDNC